MLTIENLDHLASAAPSDANLDLSSYPAVLGSEDVSSSEGYEDQSQPISIKEEYFSQPIPAPTDRDYVRQFLQYSLPRFERHADHINSTSTRAPYPYDRHLDERLRLQHVVYVPALATDLEAIADKALDNSVANHTLPLTRADANENLFPDPGVLYDALRTSQHSCITDEDPLKETYRAAIASQCLVVASTLELELPIWSSGYLRYLTQRPKNEKHAIADGYFKMVMDAPSGIPPLQEVYLEMIENFPCLGVWEFKNLLAGSIEVFEAIREHARMDRFPWTGCEEGMFCPLKHPTTSDKPLRFWAKTGPDANEPVCPSILSLPYGLPPRPSHSISAGVMTHSTHMIQQVWAEMVRNDTTLACLSSGRYEVYFQRDRETNTLYISDIIVTEAPGHAKLLTGLFIAMLRDAKNRSIQLKDSTPITWCETNPFEDCHTIDALSPEDILSEASIREWLVLTAENRCPTSSFWPDSPYLRIPSDVAAENDGSPTPDFGPFIRVVVPPQRHTGRGILQVSGNVFSGIPGLFSKTVVVKSANQPLILARLYKEYQVYSRLAASGVTCIPDVIGFFKHANSEGNPHAELHYSTLILEDVGSTSLADVAMGREIIPEDYIIECLQALQQIHNANYCFGKIELSHIMIRPKTALRGDRTRFSFVAFGDAYRTKKRWRKDQEFQELMHCLQNPLKRRLSNGDAAESFHKAARLSGMTPNMDGDSGSS